MIRALFILLAIVSLVLGFVLDNPLMYAAAGALTAVAAAMMIVMAISHRRKAELRKSAAVPPQDELNALGISGVRPRTKTLAGQDENEPVMSEPVAPSRTASVVSAPTQLTGETAPVSGQPSITRARGDLGSDGILEIRPVERDRSPASSGPTGGSLSTPAGKDGATEEAELGEGRGAALDSRDALARNPVRREVLDPVLQSMQIAIGANTVCLLRRDNGALKYHIESIVSKNAYARTKGHFTTRVPLVTPAVEKKPVITFRAGEKGIPTSNLAYYVEPIAVRQIAVAAVPQRSSESYFLLLADTMEEGGLSGKRQHGLHAHYARLLASILDGGEPLAASESTSTFRPRKDIIGEEMERARTEGDPLALILVYLNRAEEIAAEGEEAVNEAEAILEGRFRDAAAGRRVEHFGELIYAVFFVGDAATAEPFVVELQEALRDETGPLEGGVSIGVAFMKDRHESPEAFRDDANQALREAYESGACTILE